jgi:aerobic carbon-monoxide dehydrogenase small subunit
VSERVAIELTVNGERVAGAVEPRWLLADFLRDELDLTGTKLGCEHGVCGACTVLLDGQTVRSCLIFAVQCDAAEVTTVESLDEGELNVLQQEFRAHHALQCGFCTPGFLISATALLQETRHPDEAQVRDALAGNLCRCTGYEGLVDAVLAASRRLSPTDGPA